MASSYDPSLFEDARGNFSLSQRFCRAFIQFQGTISLAIQMLSTNALMQIVPRPLAYFILFIYLSLGALLGVLTAKQIYAENVQKYEDFDLLDLVCHRRKVTKRVGHNNTLRIGVLVMNFVMYCIVLNCQAGLLHYCILHMMLVCCTLFYFIRD